MIRVCFVCLGNICRSPTAEGIMRALVSEAGLDGRLEVESAGTGGWHVGEPPDRRSAACAARRGIRLESRARQFTVEDFARFDLVLPLDSQNLRALLRLAPDAAAAARVRALLADAGGGAVLLKASRGMRLERVADAL